MVKVKIVLEYDPPKDIYSRSRVSDLISLLVKRYILPEFYNMSLITVIVEDEK